MDKLIGLVGNIEQAIRYFLIGVAIVGLILLAQADPTSFRKWGEANLLLAAGLTVAIGVVTYSLYRLAWWTIGDWLAWIAGWSAPSLHPTVTPTAPPAPVAPAAPVGGAPVAAPAPIVPPVPAAASFPKWHWLWKWAPLTWKRWNSREFYPTPYARFLRWRNSEKFITSPISGYLFMRWAVAHFGVMFGVSCIVATCLAADSSIVSDHKLLFRWAGTATIVVGFLQQLFLFRVERELMRESMEFDAFKDKRDKKDPLIQMMTGSGH